MARHVSMDIETKGLDPTQHQIVALSYTKEKRNTQDLTQQVLTNQDGDEKGIVEVFTHEMQKLDNNSKIVTYNGDTFDWPFLIARSMTFNDYGELTDKLFKLKEKHSHDLFKTHGQDRYGNYLKLEELLKQHGIRHSVDCNGGEVPELVEKGEWSKIREYVKEDSLATYKLFKALEVAQND